MLFDIEFNENSLPFYKNFINPKRDFVIDFFSTFNYLFWLKLAHKITIDDHTS